MADNQYKDKTGIKNVQRRLVVSYATSRQKITTLSEVLRLKHNEVVGGWMVCLLRIRQWMAWRMRKKAHHQCLRCAFYSSTKTKHTMHKVEAREESKGYKDKNGIVLLCNCTNRVSHIKVCQIQITIENKKISIY